MDKVSRVVGSRLFARHFKGGDEPLDGIFAAMPLLEIGNFLFAHVAASCWDEPERMVMHIDIGKAHLYAPMHEDA